MKNYVENRIPPSRAQRASYQKIVEIVKANPGISIGQIKTLYYQKGVPRSDHMAGMLIQLCYNNQIKYQEVNRYIAVEPLCAN